MGRDNSAMLNEIKMRVEDIRNNFNKVDRCLKDISKKLEHKNLSKRKFVTFDRMIAISTMVIAIISLIVACVAMYTSNKLAINNSALIFMYENVDIKKITAKDGIMFEVGGKEKIRGGAKINLDVKVMSGQIVSLYLIQKQNDEFVFKLLNNGEIQNKNSGKKSYEVDSYFNMEKTEEINNIPMGMGQLYMLSEDINGQVYIDVIQIIGPIIQESAENGDIEIYDNNAEYGFRYLKNNKLITLYDSNLDEEWVNLTDSYPNILKETNIEKIEDDIAIIKEKYSRYKY